MKLSKSLAELDAYADEILEKSKKLCKSEDEEELKPEDVAEEGESTPDTDEAEEKEEPKKEEEKAESDDEGEEKEEEKSDEPAEEEEEKVEKSEESEPMEEENEESEEKEDEEEEKVEKSIDLSNMLEELSKSFSDTQAKSSEILAKSMMAVIETNKKLQEENSVLSAKLEEMEKSMASGFETIQKSFESVKANITKMAGQPARMRKSMSNINVQDRDFEKSINGVGTKGSFESLSKSQVLSVLNSELYNGNQNVTVSDIIGYETGAPLRQDLQQLVVSKVK